MPPRTHVAEVPNRIFSPIAPHYDTPALILSLYQYRRWHRFSLSQLTLPANARVLDMATGTGALAFDLLRRPDIEVVAADITRPMLLQAQQRADGAHDGRLVFIECTAEAPPFPDESYDAIVFAYLLRYVADVPETLSSLAALLQPGGIMCSLDFAVPKGVAYPAWRFYTDLILPATARLFSADWRRVGSFLGPSIREFYRRWPEDRLLDAWRSVGIADVQAKRLSLGGAIVIWGTKPQ